MVNVAGSTVTLVEDAETVTPTDESNPLIAVTDTAA